MYIFYPIFKDHFFVFKEVFSENSVLMYGLYSRAAYDGARTVIGLWPLDFTRKTKPHVCQLFSFSLTSVSADISSLKNFSWNRGEQCVQPSVAVLGPTHWNVACIIFGTRPLRFPQCTVTESSKGNLIKLAACYNSFNDYSHFYFFSGGTNNFGRHYQKHQDMILLFG